MNHSSVQCDCIFNGQAIGPVAELLNRVNGDIGRLRPWYDKDIGRAVITTNALSENPDDQINEFAVNADSALTYDQWQEVDDTILATYQQEVQVPQLIQSNYGVLNIDGMATPILTWQRRNRGQSAIITMDAQGRSDVDMHDFDTKSMPIVIIHSDISLPQRDVDVSRRGGKEGIDTQAISDSTYQVSKAAEELIVGGRTFTYGGFPTHGLTTFTERNTQVLTAPDGTNGATVVSQFATMMDKLDADGFQGPYDIMYSSNWEPWLALDFSSTKGSNTLRERILALGNIASFQKVRAVNNSTKYVVVMTHRGRRTMRLVQGMKGRPRVINWQTHAGFQEHWKILTMLQVQIFADQDDNNGLCHGSTP
jgi:uncharacterized linocin/CFP29 family protein